MWVVVLLSVLAGIIRSAPAASLITGCAVTVVLIDRSGLWVGGRETANLTASTVWWTIGEVILLVVTAFAVGRLARYGYWRWRRSRPAE